MAKLILSFDGLVQREIPLTKERTTIGRKSHNDIHIDNLAVSGEHAAVVKVAEDYFLEDLGSTNGTLINGEPVKHQLLKNSDVIELGKYKLAFVGKTPPPAQAAEEYEKTMVWRPAAAKEAAVTGAAVTGAKEPGTAAEPARGVAAAPTPASVKPAPPRPAPAAAVAAPAPAAAAPVASGAPGAAPPRGALRFLAGANAGKEVELTRPVTTLGKPGQQVAVLTRRSQGYFIGHVEGSRQPQVNGVAIGASPYALKDHDIIELTGVKAQFLVRSAGGASIVNRGWKTGLLVLVLIIVGVLVWRMRG
jgi:pSer/pThr/pTyr-binding forkhead associated (FHA) protein